MNLAVAIERKFGEMKKWHALARAFNRGLAVVENQLYLTAIVVNLNCAFDLQ